MSHSDRFGPELHPLVNEESTNSESRDSSDEIQWWVGELLVSSKEIGKSGKGTVVYKGSYKDEEVAVKRVLKSHLVDDNEIEILEKCGYHPNIASYKGHESDRDFRYLILEPCLCNLYDLIQICPAPNQHKPDLHRSMSSVTDRLEKLKVILGDFKIYNEITDCPSPLLLKLMRDMVSGLDHLHKLGIIHRDLKPENILITMEGPTLCVKLSDMDISRCLAEDKSSLSNHNTGSGTMGWTAPEKLLSRRQTCKMDMFSLGCVLFFCFTGGEHPYGDHDERNGNIKKDNKKNMYMIQDFPEVFDLISALLDYDPEKRPTAIDVLNDPMFGDADKKTSEDGGDQERKTLKGASSLAKASGSAKVSQQLDFVESGKSSICRGSTSSDTNDESTCSGSGMMGDKQNMHIMQNFPEAFHLISALLEADPKKRPKAIEAWNHPLFWDAKKRLSFLRDTSDRVRENHDLFKALKCTARSVLGTKSEGKEIQAWDKNMDDKIISHMSQSITKNYNFYSVQDLLRLIRNVLIHYTLLPKDIQILWGHLYERFDDYLRSRFPKLLTEVYKVVCEYCKEEDYFRRYFS